MTGIDVSYWQGANINWNKVMAQGISFCYVKSSEGTSRREPNAKIQAEGAKQAGLKIGYYHFAHPEKDSGSDEAEFFLVMLASLPPTDLLPVLDIEINKSNLSAEQLTKWVEDFNSVITSNGFNNLMLYSYQSFFDQFILPSEGLKKCKLWLADYRSTPHLPKAFSNYDVWQYSGKGVIEGIQGNVDLNVADESILLLN